MTDPLRAFTSQLFGRTRAEPETNDEPETETDGELQTWVRHLFNSND